MHFGPIVIAVAAVGVCEVPGDFGGAKAFGWCGAEEFDRGDDQGGGGAGGCQAPVDHVYEATLYDAGGAVAVLDEVLALLLTGLVLDVVAALVAAGEEIDFEVVLLGHLVDLMLINGGCEMSTAVLSRQKDSQTRSSV